MPVADLSLKVLRRLIDHAQASEENFNSFGMQAVVDIETAQQALIVFDYIGTAPALEQIVKIGEAHAQLALEAATRLTAKMSDVGGPSPDIMPIARRHPQYIPEFIDILVLSGSKIAVGQIGQLLREYSESSYHAIDKILGFEDVGVERELFDTAYACPDLLPFCASALRRMDTDSAREYLSGLHDLFDEQEKDLRTLTSSFKMSLCIPAFVSPPRETRQPGVFAHPEYPWG